MLKIYIRLGVGNITRYLALHEIVRKVGIELSRVLTAVHCLTGCDYTSKFGTKHAALKASPEKMLPAIIPDIGSHEVSNLLVKIDSAEKYICQVLKKGTSCTKMDDLR